MSTFIHIKFSSLDCFVFQFFSTLLDYFWLFISIYIYIYTQGSFVKDDGRLFIIFNCNFSSLQDLKKLQLKIIKCSIVFNNNLLPKYTLFNVYIKKKGK